MSAAHVMKKIVFKAPEEPQTLAYQVFGVRSVESEPATVRLLVMRGMPPAELNKVREVYAVSQTELAKLLGVTTRTLTRKGKAQKRLGFSASDGTARLVRVFDRAVEVLGEPNRVREWLRSPNDALGGDPPHAWLDTDAGTAEVLRVLGRLEHGVFS